MYDGNANQLTEMGAERVGAPPPFQTCLRTLPPAAAVPVDRIIAELGEATKKANSTDVILDNASDLKPGPMTTGERRALGRGLR